MNAKKLSEEETLVEEATALLRRLVPAGWRVQGAVAEPALRTVQGRQARPKAAITLEASDGVSITMPVEAKRSVFPRDVDGIFAGFARGISVAGPAPGLVVAPWLSQRTQDLLAADGINYLDLTGNVRLTLEKPAIFVRVAGAGRPPERRARGQVRVRGPKAGRLIRFLADVRPPYNVTQVAAAVGLAPGYVSRLLGTLDNEAIVDRSRRGRVEAVDYEALLRRWAEARDLFKQPDVMAFIAPVGVVGALARLADPASDLDLVITGSFAASRLAPVSAPALLVAYTDDADSIVSLLTLLPADEGANVVLLKPFDPVVCERVARVDGLAYVAPSQAAVDCLAGNGRMPQEGEALLGWMKQNEALWRIPSLEAFAASTGLR